MNNFIVINENIVFLNSVSKVEITKRMDKTEERYIFNFYSYDQKLIAKTYEMSSASATSLLVEMTKVSEGVAKAYLANAILVS